MLELQEVALPEPKAAEVLRNIEAAEKSCLPSGVDLSDVGNCGGLLLSK